MPPPLGFYLLFRQRIGRYSSREKALGTDVFDKGAHLERGSTLNLRYEMKSLSSAGGPALNGHLVMVNVYFNFVVL